MSSAPSWLRAFALPRLAKCPASGVESEGKLDPRRVAATDGVAWHALAELIVVEGRKKAAEHIERVAREHGAKAEVLQDWFQRLTWETPPISRGEPEVWLDLKLGDHSARGCADVVLDYEEDDLVEVIDWKTNNPDFADPDAQMVQLFPYVATAARDRKRKRARASLCYVELGDQGWTHLEMDPLDAQEETDKIAKRALRQMDQPQTRRDYHVGDHCTWCPARFECPARLLEVKHLASLPSEKEALLPLVTPENGAALWERASQMDRVTRAVKEIVKDLVRTNGEIPAGEGKVMRLVEQGRRGYTVQPGKQYVLRVFDREDADTKKEDAGHP